MNLEIILSGLTGTLAMTLFADLISIILKKPFHVVRNLSRMLRHSDNAASTHKRNICYCVALVVHYTIGILFAYAFDFAVKQEWINLTLWQAILFGGLAGLAGILGWRIAFGIHPNPPKIDRLQYLSVIWIGHLIFAIGTFLTYIKFFPTSIRAAIPIC